MKAGSKFYVKEDYTDVDFVSVKAGQSVTYKWKANVSSYGKNKVIAAINGEEGQEIILPKELLTTRKPKVTSQSARHNEGKTQTREIDPAFILGMGEVLTKSRAKYDHFNWCKPTKLSTPYESAMRHLMAFQSGENIDQETGLSHLLHVATNIMFMHYHITNNPEECDDRFFKKDKK